MLGLASTLFVRLVESRGVGVVEGGSLVRPPLEPSHWALEHALLRASMARRVRTSVALWALAATVFGFLWAKVAGAPFLARGYEAALFGLSAAAAVGADRVVGTSHWANGTSFAAKRVVATAVAHGILGVVMGACVGLGRDGAALGGLVGGAVGGVLRRRKRASGAAAAAAAKWASSSHFADEVRAAVAEGSRDALACAAVAAVCAAASWGRPRAHAATFAAAHAAFAATVAVAVGVSLVAAAALQPLNFDVVAARGPPRTATAVSCLLAALEIGDPPPGAVSSAETADHHHNHYHPGGGKTKTATAGTRSFGGRSTTTTTTTPGGERKEHEARNGWYGTPKKTPGRGDAPQHTQPPVGGGGLGAAVARSWRADVDELRVAVYRLAQAADLDRAGLTALAPESALSLGSGGLVLGSNRVPLTLRAVKFVAVRDLETYAAEAAQVPGFASRAIRACLLLIDGLTLRIHVATGSRPARLDPERRVLRSQDAFAWVADALSENNITNLAYDNRHPQPVAPARTRPLHEQQQQQHSTTATRTWRGAGDPLAALSDLETTAVCAAARAVCTLLPAVADDPLLAHHVPLALCSLVGALHTLRECNPPNHPTAPRHHAGRTHDVDLALRRAAEHVARAYAPHIALYTYPSMYVSTIHRLLDDQVLLLAGNNSSQTSSASDQGPRL